MKTIAALLFLCFASYNLFALAPNGSIMGQVTDPVTKKPVGDATVVFDCQGSQKTFFANENGFYYASNIPPCVYTVTVLYLSKTQSYPGVKIVDGDQRELNLQLVVTEDTLIEIPIVADRGIKPLLDPLNPTDVTVDQRDIAVLPKTDLGSIIEFQSGITVVNGEYYVHGARAGSLVFYLDDARIMGNPEVPVSALDNYHSYTGFLPAKYGDTDGGAIVMETRSYFSER